jgi:hypothetical protein
MVLPEFDPKTTPAGDPDVLGTRRDSTTLATPGAASQRNPDVSPQNGPQANDGTKLEERRYGWHQDSTWKKLSKMKPQKKTNENRKETESETINKK